MRRTTCVTTECQNLLPPPVDKPGRPRLYCGKACRDRDFNRKKRKRERDESKSRTRPDVASRAESYLADVAGWVDYLRRVHANRVKLPRPVHGDGHLCPPCHALRLLAEERASTVES